MFQCHAIRCPMLCRMLPDPRKEQQADALRTECRDYNSRARRKRHRATERGTQHKHIRPSLQARRATENGHRLNRSGKDWRTITGTQNGPAWKHCRIPGKGLKHSGEETAGPSAEASEHGREHTREACSLSFLPAWECFTCYRSKTAGGHCQGLREASRRPAGKGTI